MKISTVRGARWLAAIALVAGLVTMGPLTGAQAAAGCSGGPGGYPPTTGTLGLSVTVVVPPGTITISGTGFAPGVVVSISFLGGGRPGSSTSATAGADGSISSTIAVPAGTPAGDYTIVATGANPKGGCLTLAGAAHAANVLGTNTGAAAGTTASFIVSRSTFVQGQSGTATGSGCGPSTAVTFYLDSTSTTIGSTTSDAQGNFSGSFTIPDTTPLGKHTLISVCNDPLTQTASIEVVAATTTSLPVTGADVLPWALAIVVLFAVGGALMVVSRRRNHAKQS